MRSKRLTDPSPSPCTFSVCDDAIGAFTHPPRPDGTLCLNDTICDGSESCRNGTCAAGLPLLVDDGNVCTVDACSATTGVTHTPIAGCDPTPVRGDAPFETRASILGTLVTSTGGAVTGATFTVYDDRAAGAPRSDVSASSASDGSFRLKLTAFPDVEPPRTPPHHLIVVIDSPGTIRAYREGYAHAGEIIDVGIVKLIGRDPTVTTIGPAGGTASDSRGLVQLVIAPGALATTVPIQITPLTARDQFPAPLPGATVTMYGFELEPSGTTFASPVTVRLSNYRNLPPSLTIPVGSFDPIAARWEHEGVATWNGTRFQTSITHFSTYDCNSGPIGDRSARPGGGGGPNGPQPPPKPCVGSAWHPNGGSIAQSFSLPGVRARGEDFALSLHYDSGLAASRKLGGAPAQDDVVARGTLAVSTSPIRMVAEPRRDLLCARRRGPSDARGDRAEPRGGVRRLAQRAARAERGDREQRPRHADLCALHDGSDGGVHRRRRRVRGGRSRGARRARQRHRARARSAPPAQGAAASPLLVAVWCRLGHWRGQPPLRVGRRRVPRARRRARGRVLTARAADADGRQPR